MTLSQLAILLGAGIAIPQIWALLKPAEAGAALRKFPRSEGWGYLLMAIGAGWFLYRLNQEAIAEFAAYKSYMLLGFAAVAVAACFFVPDFLAVRGMAITTLMLSAFILSKTRFVDTPWRLVLVVLAYIWIIASMWWMISPWRCRDIIGWATATPQRLRAIAATRLAFALLVIVLGVTAYK
ncbi:MAG TPA: hypothetical protein VM680_09420 [Verrucomicrobiae bacterium]|nr:hypothetical protein [Verrucomicrobiae bacterium]